MPLVAVPRARLFIAVVAVAGLFLAFISLWGAIVGLGAYAPSAVLLLVAAFVPASWRPRVKRVVLAVALIGGSVVLVSSALAVYDTYLRPPNGYRVYLRAHTSPAEAEALINRMSEIPGVGGVGSSFPAGGAPLTVFFEEVTSLPEQARLGERLHAFPGVLRVELCRCP